MHDDEDQPLRQRFTRRALLIGGGQGALFGLLGWRLHQLQVVDASKYALLADENRINVQFTAPIRGRILDRFGNKLVTNRENLRVTIVPDLAGDLDQALAQLGTLVEIPQAERDRVLARAKRQNRHLPIVVTDDISWREFAEINVLAPRLPGVTTDVGSIRVYHGGSDMAHVTGYVGAADKSEIDEDPVLRLPGFRVGKSGAEKGFEDVLRGKAGRNELEVDVRGRVIRTLDSKPSVPGSELVLTVDNDLQTLAMDRIKDERRAAVTCVDTDTGEILIMASTPSFNPNEIVFGFSSDVWKKLNANPDDPLTNKCLRGQYPPGSTFKVVTALAGLEEGVIDADTQITCKGYYTLGHGRYGCWKHSGHGALTVFEAIQHSCDVFFYETANRLGIDRLAVMGRKMGIGHVHEFGMPLQKPGVMPDEDWKRKTLGEQWYGGETVIAGIGQGYVLATPLELALVSARVASGMQIEPRIVRPGPGDPPSAPVPLDIDPEYLSLVRGGMHAVVNLPGGTAGRAKLPIEGVEMAGKTGTSQVSRASHGRHNESLVWNLRDHALFICFAPTDKPKYAMSVVVEHGGSGSHTASPIARDIMTEIIKRDPLGLPAYTSPQPAQKTASRSGEPDEI